MKRSIYRFCLLCLLMTPLVLSGGCSKLFQKEQLYFTVEGFVNGEFRSDKETRPAIEHPWKIKTPIYYSHTINDHHFGMENPLFRISLWPSHLDSSSIVNKKKYYIHEIVPEQNKDTAWYDDDNIMRRYYLVSGSFMFLREDNPENKLSYSFLFDCSMAYGSDTIHITNGRIDIYKVLQQDNSMIVDPATAD